MRIGTIHHTKLCWPNHPSQRLSAIKLAVNRIALRSKLLSLNQQYQALIHSIKGDGKANSFQVAQEAYWYDTACLMEESRKLKLRFPNTVIPQSSLTDTSKTTQILENRPLYAQILSPTFNRPPSVIPIVILSLLHGISIAAGILWLVAPHLMNS